MWAISIHAFELSIDFSQSLANLRQRLSHAKVHSTTHRRGITSKPSTASVKAVDGHADHVMLLQSFKQAVQNASITPGCSAGFGVLLD